MSVRVDPNACASMSNAAVDPVHVLQRGCHGVADTKRRRKKRTCRTTTKQHHGVHYMMKYNRDGRSPPDNWPTSLQASQQKDQKGQKRGSLCKGLLETELGSGQSARGQFCVANPNLPRMTASRKKVIFITHPSLTPFAACGEACEPPAWWCISYRAADLLTPAQASSPLRALPDCTEDLVRQT